MNIRKWIERIVDEFPALRGVVGDVQDARQAIQESTAEYLSGIAKCEASIVELRASVAANDDGISEAMSARFALIESQMDAIRVGIRTLRSSGDSQASDVLTHSDKLADHDRALFTAATNASAQGKQLSDLLASDRQEAVDQSARNTLVALDARMVRVENRQHPTSPSQLADPSDEKPGTDPTPPTGLPKQARYHRHAPALDHVSMYPWASGKMAFIAGRHVTQDVLKGSRYVRVEHKIDLGQVHIHPVSERPAKPSGYPAIQHSVDKRARWQCTATYRALTGKDIPTVFLPRVMPSGYLVLDLHDPLRKQGIPGGVGETMKLIADAIGAFGPMTMQGLYARIRNSHSDTIRAAITEMLAHDPPTIERHARRGQVHGEYHNAGR